MDHGGASLGVHGAAWVGHVVMVSVAGGARLVISLAGGGVVAGWVVTGAFVAAGVVFVADGGAAAVEF